ncbi:MAG: PDZ domain-containing protein [Planctomycetes bacterium]|nr:PDZ domain-containing protein [Planctomycetota bacterium]
MRFAILILSLGLAPAEEPRQPPASETAGAPAAGPPVLAAAPAAPLESYLGAHATAVKHLEEREFEETGLSVTEVVENSPAHEAGIQPGDRLLTLAGKPLRTPQQLEAQIASFKPGTEVELEVRRENRKFAVKARTVPRLAPRPAPPSDPFVEDRRLGATVASLTEPEARAENLPLGEGARIIGFYPGSPLEAAGLEKGDVLWKLAGEPVYGGEDFLARLRNVEPDVKVELEVSRRGERRALAVRTSNRLRSLQYFHFPGIVIYEWNPRKKDKTFGVLLNLFKFTRHDEERTYRLFYLIFWTTGDNEELRKVEP